ncbi:MAG: Rnase Y domain-containing protein, partial [Gemmatimonadota bacterium]|nr:Rnase Y domain-containing protein [Gemmatimonadota bacterium]
MTGLEVAAIILAVAGPSGAFIAYRVGAKGGRETELAARRAARDTAEDLAKRILGDAERDADTLRKQATLAGKEEAMRAREEWELEARRRREEIEREEKRLQEREVVLDRKFDVIETRDKDLGRRATDIGRKEKAVDERQGELDRLLADERRRLEQLAGLSAGEAKAELMRRMEEEAAADAANRLREVREAAKRNADRESRKIVALAVQRIAAEPTAEI